MTHLQASQYQATQLVYYIIIFLVYATVGGINVMVLMHLREKGKTHYRAWLVPGLVSAGPVGKRGGGGAISGRARPFPAPHPPDTDLLLHLLGGIRCPQFLCGVCRSPAVAVSEERSHRFRRIAAARPLWVAAGRVASAAPIGRAAGFLGRRVEQLGG